MWLERLGKAGVPCGPINTVPMVFEDPQIKERGMLIEVEHPVAGKVPLVVSPMRFRTAGLSYNRHPPLLGEHTEEVLRELGLDDAAPAPPPRSGPAEG